MKFNVKGGVVDNVLGNMGYIQLGKVMRKGGKVRVDLDYIIEKDRKESRKRAKAWRDMRKNQIKMKRHHDITTPEDGRVLIDDEGIGYAKNKDGVGLGGSQEGWDGKMGEESV